MPMSETRTTTATIVNPGDSDASDTARYYALRENFTTQITQQKESTQALAADVQGLKQSVGALFQKIDLLANSLEQKGRPNVAVLALLASIVLGIVPGGWFIINNAVANAIAPVTARLGQVETFDSEANARIAQVAQNENTTSRDSAAATRDIDGIKSELGHQGDTLGKLSDASAGSIVADGISRTDRTQLNDRLRQVEQTIASGAADRRNGFAEIAARMLEIEQQFHSISNISNLRWNQQNNINAMTYEKLHPGDRYPTTSFFPTDIFQSSPPGLIAGQR